MLNARCLNGHVSIWKASQIPVGIATAVAVIVAHKAARGVTKESQSETEISKYRILSAEHNREIWCENE